MNDWSDILVEEWRAIPGYEGYYEVSNFGQIRSLDHERVAFKSSYVMKGRILKQSKGNSGYFQVNLSKLGKQKIVMVHRIVAKVFVKNDNPDKKIAVNHKDGIKTNNFAENLEWITYSDNQKHAYKNGLNRWVPGKGVPQKPVVQLDKDTGELISEYVSIGEAARAIGSKYDSGISGCCSGRCQTSKGYKWMLKEDYENQQFRLAELVTETV